MSRRLGEWTRRFACSGNRYWVGAALLYGVYKATSENQYRDTETVIADNEDKCRIAANVIRRHCDNFQYLGMNCLWTNYSHNRRDPVALLQLATNQGFCLIIRLSDLQNNISMDLKNILNDSNILKVGVGIDQMALFIKHDHDIDITGKLDLRLLAGETNVSERSLRDLARVLCGMNIKKPNAFSEVKWSKETLSATEKDYAKSLAIASIKVFEKLREHIVQSS